MITLLSGESFTLSLAGHEISLVDVLTIEKNSLVLDKVELIHWVDNPADDNRNSLALGIKNDTKSSVQGASAIECKVFIAIKNLTADQVLWLLVSEFYSDRYHSKNTLEQLEHGLKRRDLRAAIDVLLHQGRLKCVQCQTLIKAENKSIFIQWVRQTQMAK